MNREQIIGKLNTILKSGVTQSSIASAIGKSESAISKYLKGVYAGNVEGLEEDLTNYIHKFEFYKNKRCYLYIRYM